MDTMPLFDDRADVPDQFLYIRRSGVTRIDDEIGMFFGHGRRTHAKSLQSG
jgi:hypothetical protein